MDYVLTGKAARGLAQLLRGNRGNTGGGGTAYGVVSPDDYALPFTVRWSATANNWVIWLPSLASLVCVDGAAVAITGATAAQNLAAGWYTVSGVSTSSTEIYLNITIPDADQTGATTTAELSAAASSSSTGNTVYPLTVATMATDSSTGAKRVRQSLTSCVAIGGGSGSGGEGGGGGGGGITVTGNDSGPSTISGVTSLKFASAADSNVVVSVSAGQGAGEAVATIGVYYTP